MYQLQYGVPLFPSLAVLLSILNRTLNHCRLRNTGLLLFIFAIVGVNAGSTKGGQIKNYFFCNYCAFVFQGVEQREERSLSFY